MNNKIEWVTSSYKLSSGLDSGIQHCAEFLTKNGTVYVRIRKDVPYVGMKYYTVCYSKDKVSWTILCHRMTLDEAMASAIEKFKSVEQEPFLKLQKGVFYNFADFEEQPFKDEDIIRGMYISGDRVITIDQAGEKFRQPILEGKFLAFRVMTFAEERHVYIAKDMSEITKELRSTDTHYKIPMKKLKELSDD